MMEKIGKKHLYEFDIGRRYAIGGKILRFVKVTKKRFNLLSEETGRCIFAQPLYDRRHSKKKLPFSQTTFRIEANPKYAPRKAKLFDTLQPLNEEEWACWE